MRFSLSLLSVLASSVASLAWADDITVNSQVTEVTVYPEVAAITRRAEFDLPIGQHRLILSNIPYSADLETLQLDLTGARQTALLFREDGAPPRRADDPEVLAAEAVIKEVEARMQAVWFAIGFGILGYLMRRVGMSPLPFVIAFILGDKLEDTARQAFAATGGDGWFLFNRPIAALFMVLAITFVILSLRKTSPW